MKKRNTIIAVAMALLLAGGTTAGAMGFGGMMNGMGFMNHNQVHTETEKVDMTEEQKAEMLEKAKEQLASLLEEGKITQEQYDEQLAKLESGEMPVPLFGNMGNGKGFGFGNFGKNFGSKEFEAPEIPEMTEEQKAEMLEKAKEQLASLLEEGKITQEQYDEQLAKLESDEMPVPLFGNMGNGKGFGFGNFGKDFGNFGKDFGNFGKDFKGREFEADTEATEDAVTEGESEKTEKIPVGGRRMSRGNGFGPMSMGAGMR